MSDRTSPSAVALLFRQVGYQNRLFIRTPIAAMFTLVFPLIFLVLFGAIFEGVDLAPGEEVSPAQFYAPGLAVFAAVSATYTNVGIGVAIYRDEGVLKRIRGTPLPRWIYMGGVVGSGVAIAAGGAVVMLAVGFLVYGIEMDADRILPALVTFVVGVATFSLLGLALAAVAPSGQSAPALANATLLPVAFISNVFISVRNEPPAWLDLLGDIFPLKAFSDAFFAAFDPFEEASAYKPWLLLWMGVWALAGAMVAVRKFRWEPSTGAGGGGGRRGRR
ncbi:MAG: ABC transporter permease [Acidimicrobiales bacterium]|jgi:ABC-2 type transport system permease protein|nr:ABC transporter permease [Acidimicrobiales bacterium]MDP7259091.1 ABC transporter permease [Acidimicrobiales bacterium]HJO79403.1 ABC transporter permease [Acidimicrobiales bacterium]|tara:strand:+ start:6101 stop:6928 length:828 start_codon:yes stop_codon:yes gene_type:complete